MLKNNQNEAKSSDEIIQLLSKNNLIHNLITHGLVKTMEDVRRELPTANPADMIKSVLVEVTILNKTNYILCGMPADKKLNFENLSHILKVPKKSIKMVNINKVKEVTELEAGCLSPLLMPPSIQVYLDKSFGAKELLWCGIGTYHHSLKLSLDQFKMLCNNFEFVELTDQVQIKQTHNP